MHDDHDHGRPPDTHAGFAEIEGVEQYVLTSAGSDIGSSTSQPPSHARQRAAGAAGCPSKAARLARRPSAVFGEDELAAGG